MFTKCSHTVQIIIVVGNHLRVYSMRVYIEISTLLIYIVHLPFQGKERLFECILNKSCHTVDQHMRQRIMTDRFLALCFLVCVVL